ncbi:hypothetical protein [Streptomyces sp. NPDC048248]|uniref:hypothetical protein n=1 Tax=Streptomyces sp. NPDC048248 TaxID=3365523 RepID=UPI003722A5EB
MKLWPWKMLRRASLDELLAAAATGEVDNAEAAELAAELEVIREDRDQLLKQRAELQITVQDLRQALRNAQDEFERLQEEADTSADKADGLSHRLELWDETITRLQAELADARHGESEVYVLQSRSAPISAARSRQGAINAAGIFGVPAEGWEPSDGPRTDGWEITRIHLMAEEPQDIPSQARR